MKGCLRPARSASRSRMWLESRLRKFWLQQAPPEIKKVGELWGRGQIQINLEGHEWRGRIRRCEFSELTGSTFTPKMVDVKVVLYWFAHKKVSHWLDANLIKRSKVEWDRLHHPYELCLTFAKCQQTKVKPKRLYFETSGGELGYFSMRKDPENVSWRKERINDPTLK